MGTHGNRQTHRDRVVRGETTTHGGRDAPVQKARRARHRRRGRPPLREENPDKAGKYLDQAAEFVDKQTKGKYRGQIDGAAQKAKGVAGIPTDPGSGATAGNGCTQGYDQNAGFGKTAGYTAPTPPPSPQPPRAAAAPSRRPTPAAPQPGQSASGPER